MTVVKKERAPVERLLSGALVDFEAHLQRIGMTGRVQDARLRGAREFVVFLLGRGPQKYERTKGMV